MTPDERAELEDLATAYVRERRIEPRCGAVLTAYSEPVTCQREAGHPGTRHETSGVSWVAA